MHAFFLLNKNEMTYDSTWNTVCVDILYLIPLKMIWYDSIYCDLPLFEKHDDQFFCTARSAFKTTTDHGNDDDEKTCLFTFFCSS